MFRTKVEPKTVRLKDPLNTEIASLYTKLLAEHTALLVEHRLLLTKLRETPLYAAPSGERLWVSEDQEDAAQLRLAPAYPNPFEDDRQDEAELRFASNLLGNAELN